MYEVGLGSAFTVPATSKVIVQDMVTFVRDDGIVASLHAEVDFKDLPPELHEAAVNWLLRRRGVIGLRSAHPVARAVLPSTPVAPMPSIRKPWYRRFL